MHRPFRVSPPALGPTTVVRPRLLRSLSKRFDARVVAIEAGAGLGKTTLLAQAVAENLLAPRGRDIWLTCEPADGSSTTLLTAILEAMGITVGGEQPRVEQVCELVWSATPEHVCLVFDDIHLVDGASEGAAAVRRLLDELPENGHLVVAGRQLPALPRSRLVAQGRAVELGDDELRFDDGESVEVAAVFGVGLDVIRGANGWPALAELYARVGRAHAEQFVWEEVMDRLPEPDVVAFLRIVAVGGAEADLLEAVVGGPCDGEVLCRLPLVSSDGHGAIRPHALWSELLRNHIDASDATAARRRLAIALVERADHGPAFELLAAIGDWERALSVLFDACNDQKRPPWRDQMQRWRALVPEGVAREPEVRYLEAMAERSADPWSSRALELFSESIAAFRHRGDRVKEMSASVRAAFGAWLRGDRAFLDAMYARGTELIAEGLPLEGMRAFNRAVVADIDGATDDARACTDDMRDLEPRVRHFAPLIRVLAGLADGAAELVLLDAERAATQAAPVAPAAGTGWAALAPSLVAWSSGDLASVLRCPPADPGARFSIAERVPSMALSAIVAAHLGRTDAAEREARAIDALVPDMGDRDLLAGFRALVAAAIYVNRGDEAGAAHAIGHELDGRPLSPAGAGRAVRWCPSLFYLYHDEARALLDSLPSGPSRSHTLDVCRALVAARENGAHVRSELLRDPAKLITALPVTLAVELVTRAAVGGPSAWHVGSIAGLADVAPVSVRDALRRLAESGRADPVRVAARALLATVPIPPDRPVRIEVFGPTRLIRDGVVVDEPGWRRQRARQALCVLVAYHEIRRSRLGALLWPEFDEKAVSANLRTTLSYVQSLLEPGRARGDAPWFLQQAAGVLRLRESEHLSVDAWDFDAELDAAEAAAAAGASSVELGHLLRAVSLWHGDYLDDLAGEEWAEPLQERARLRMVKASVRAGELLLAGGRAGDAARQAEMALSVNPWSEPALRLLIGVRLAAGDRAGALDAYHAGLRALADLGVEPEAATQELVHKLMASSG